MRIQISFNNFVATDGWFWNFLFEEMLVAVSVLSIPDFNCLIKKCTVCVTSKNILPIFSFTNFNYCSSFLFLLSVKNFVWICFWRQCAGGCVVCVFFFPYIQMPVLCKISYSKIPSCRSLLKQIKYLINLFLTHRCTSWAVEPDFIHFQIRTIIQAFSITGSSTKISDVLLVRR